MRYAFVADVHGDVTGLEKVLDDVGDRGVDRVITLGDVGSDRCYQLLQQAGAIGVFGNWEVSGWRSLSTESQAYVLEMSAVYEGNGFVAAHALPWGPAGLKTVMDYGAYIARTCGSWRDLFPYVHENRQMLWDTLVYLAPTCRRILFHGHTHVQAGWQLEAGGRLRAVMGPQIPLDEAWNNGTCFVIGVGSVGRPLDGSCSGYVFYDSQARQAEWITLDTRG